METTTENTEWIQEGLGGIKLGWPDIVVILLYFLFVMAVGLISSWKSQRGSVTGYFMASRNMHWIPVGASLFASNIGSGHFIGLAGAGAASGISVALFEMGSIYRIMVLGWMFVPVYMSSGVLTMPEYLRERFGRQRIRVYLSVLALLLYIFTKISADLYAGALFMQLALNKSSDEWLYISIIILLAVAAVFTIAGGLAAVVWTDFVQTVLMVVGAFILMALSLREVGGYQELINRYPYATASVQAKNKMNESCGEPRSDYMNLMRSVSPGESDYPWTGMIFGNFINSIWYWCADQVIVQRTLAAKNTTHAKAGCIFAGYLKILPLFILVIPGMAARILFPDRVACASPELCKEICGSAGGCSNIAYVELVLNLLPTGLAGLMLAVMMAALMTSLTSIFNSASTIFTIDVWLLLRRWGKDRGWCKGTWGSHEPSSKELLIVGKLFVVVLVVISVIWIPVIQTTGNSQLFDYIQSISSFLAPPISAVYLLAVFWPRTNEPGAFWGLMGGLCVGMIRFMVEFSYVIPPCGSDKEDPRPWLVKKLVGDVHYLHFSIILWMISTIITISVSIITRPIDKRCLYRLTYWSRHDTRVRRPQKPRSSAKEQIISSDPLKTVSNMEVEEQSGYKFENGELSEEQRAKNATEFLKETPHGSCLVNWNCIICLIITTFILGFYA